MAERVVVVGLGLIGGSLAKALTGRAGCTVLGIDQNPAVVEKAVACGAIAREADAADLRDADVLYLCLYPQATIDFVRAHGAERRRFHTAAVSRRE